MKPDIIGLNRLKSFFPDNFNIIGECLKSDISIIRLFHLKPETSEGSDKEKLYTIIHEVVQKYIRGIIEQKTGIILGYFDPADSSINLNADLDRGRISNELNREQGINIDPEQVYIWIYYHELGHKQGLKELRADAFANQKFSQWRSEIY